MPTDTPGVVFRRFYEQAWTHGALAVVNELLAPTFINHELPDAPDPRAAYCQAVRDTRAAFPDWTLAIHDLRVDGERVAARWSAWGTHTGHAWGLAPTRCTVQVQGMTMVRIVNGQITDFWKQDTSHTLMQQLAATVAGNAPSAEAPNA